MNGAIAAAIDRARTVLTVLAMILVFGAVTYATMPREAAPDIDIPIFYVTVTHSGVSPQDVERLITRPLERGLHTLDGIDEILSWSGEGFSLVRLDFRPGYDNRRALNDLREEVDRVRPALPAEADEPQVMEVDLSLFPVLTVALSGPIPERALVQTARRLRDRIEALPGVLSAEIGGDRDDLMEVAVDPLVLETYRISWDEVVRAIRENNRLAAVGVMDTGAGRVAVRVPGTIEDPRDLLDTALRAADGTVLTVGDVATVRQTFRDPTGFARIDGQPAVSLEVRKRSGANVLEVVAAARAAVESERQGWPASLQATYLQDQAEAVSELLGDLQNSVLTAVLLVMLTMLLTLGFRAGILTALAIPGAFLTGILAISGLGFTLNIVVLFALILVVGMLVDGAIIVVELADRHLAEGMTRRRAFQEAAARMAWPVITSVATTLAVFVPMLFWPGMVGEFIRYLPATVSITLLASLMMALVFVPVLGAVAGPRNVTNPDRVRRIRAAEAGDFTALNGAAAGYHFLLKCAVHRPGLALTFTVAGLAALYGAYAMHGRGVDFFPHIEPEFAQIQVQARGDLSVREADSLVRRVEDRVRGIPGVEAIYTRTIGSQQARLQANLSEDVVGIIQLEFLDWRLRPPAVDIIDRIRERTRDLPGVVLQIREHDRGVGEGRPVVVQVGGTVRDALQETVELIRARMDDLGGFLDVEDDRPLPGVELALHIDRSEAGRYGATVATLSDALQLLTDGYRLGSYRPEFTDEEVDIRLRFPLGSRDLGTLTRLRLPSAQGLVPIANFVEFRPRPGTGILKRIGGTPAYTIQADVAPGELVDERTRALAATLVDLEVPPGVEVRMRGQAEEQQEATAFLALAFLLALFLMVIMLVTQFNSFLQTLLVLSAIVLSTAGVLLGLLIRGEPFGIVMSGIGVLALAGIVVNNNIVLIDTFNRLRRDGLAPVEAALRTGVQRLRPVVLTAVTTVLALIPMVLALTIDLLGRDVHFGAPATQYWVQLSTAIAGGLLVATPLTLIITPAMLAWIDGRKGTQHDPSLSEAATGTD